MSSPYKAALDQLVSERTGVHRRKVASVTAALFEEIIQQLAHTGEATIPNVGTLRVFIADVQREVALTPGGQRTKKRSRFLVQTHVRIYFSKAARLRAALKEKGYGEVRSKRVG